MKPLDGYIDTYCGLKCDGCEFIEKCGCTGCIASGGHPFHGECEVAECARANGRRYCGECADFPCEILTRYTNDPEHGDTPPGARVENCRRVKAQMVADARRDLEPVGFCGHHCDHCFLGLWCGGCRSDYNCCSYATICEGGICPNLECAQSRNLFGCWDCPELDGCKKGYFSNKDEHAAKAASMFIRKHGLDCYKELLPRAISFGLDYAKALDAAGTDDKALALLETYLRK